MTTFILPEWSSTVEVSLPSNLTQAQLLGHRPFQEWLRTLQKSLLGQEESDHAFHDKNERYSLRSVNVQSADWFGKRLGFVKFEAVLQNVNDGRPLPGITFLRGGSVAILIILRPDDDSDERYVIMTQQPRIPAGSLSFYEIPAGMIDDSGTFKFAAAKELREETGLRVPEAELVNLTELALRKATGPEAHLQKAMYTSPGGSDEFIALFLWDVTKPIIEINELRDKLTGTDREKITVRLVKYDELWREGARDAKTLAAWALYEGLTREGVLNGS